MISWKHHKGWEGGQNLIHSIMPVYTSSVPFLHLDFVAYRLDPPAVCTESSVYTQCVHALRWMSDSPLWRLQRATYG